MAIVNRHNKRERTVATEPERKNVELQCVALLLLAEKEITTNNFNAAETHYARALELAEDRLGEGDVLTAGVLVSFSRVHMEKKRYEKAEEFLRRAAAIQGKELGTEHRDYIYTMKELGRLRDIRRKENI